MYYLDEIMERTFSNWSTMLSANNNSFWSVSEIEVKPTPVLFDNSAEQNEKTKPIISKDTIETKTFEPADTTVPNTSTSSNQVSDVLHGITDTAQKVIEDINPFKDR